MPTINKLSLDGILYDFGGGIDTSDATALASDILLGKTAYARGSKLEGTIPLLEETEYTPTTENQVIEFGKYLNGNQIIKGDPNLLAENLFNGINIFGVEGKLDILAIFGYGGSEGHNRGGACCWNGYEYSYTTMNGGNSFFGTPIKAFISYTPGGILNICGVSISESKSFCKEIDVSEFTSNTISHSNSSITQDACNGIILGLK